MTDTQAAELTPQELATVEIGKHTHPFNSPSITTGADAICAMRVLTALRKAGWSVVKLEEIAAIPAVGPVALATPEPIYRVTDGEPT